MFLKDFSYSCVVGIFYCLNCLNCGYKYFVIVKFVFYKYKGFNFNICLSVCVLWIFLVFLEDIGFREKVIGVCVWKLFILMVKLLGFEIELLWY